MQVHLEKIFLYYFPLLFSCTSNDINNRSNDTECQVPQKLLQKPSFHTTEYALKSYASGGGGLWFVVVVWGLWW